MKSIIQNIKIQDNISLAIKREDLLHPYVSGNKYRKLKYNIMEAKSQDTTLLITFGGAFSNHIVATAYACKIANIKCVGIIRGEELLDNINDNSSLLFAQECGMTLDFISRSKYQEKDSEDFHLELLKKYGNYYHLPEGGTNYLAIQGCEEILNQDDAIYDYICCPVGTGGTVSGIINATNCNQKVLAFSALKGNFLKEDIAKFAKNDNWELITQYHFGGYAKVTPQLVYFINAFYKNTKVPLDPVYTAKMVYGVYDLIENNFFPPQSKILMIHTGGLQGIRGMNNFLEKKKINKILFND